MLRFLAATAARNEESLGEGSRRVADDDEWNRQAAAAAEESRKAEAETRGARRTEDEARRAAEAETREARRAEDEARRKEEAEAREANRRDDLERERRFEALIAEDIRQGDEAFDASSRKLEEAIHRMAGDGDPLRGQVVVALDEESLPPLLDAAGIAVDRELLRLRTWRKGRWREWELVAAGYRVAVVIEIEPTLRMHDVRRCRSRMRTFRAWRPEFDRPEMRIYGALAYLSAKPAALRFAERRGFLLIGVDDSGAGLRNSPGFEPASF